MALPGASPGLLKFTTIALYVMVIFGLVFGVVRGVSVWQKTGDKGPFIEATAGQILAWDTGIYDGIQTLKEGKFIETLPPQFRDTYRQFVVKQVVFFLILFLILTYALFKLASWALGAKSFEPTTDLIVLAVILFVVFPFSELVYGLVMDKNVIPYRGVAQLIKPSTWDLLLGEVDLLPPDNISGEYADYQRDIEREANNLPNNVTLIDLNPGGV
tara:strand:+ start:287 stop:931 length:645 start_codon:yes stop_codon:yes gene_type:complete